MKNNTRFGGFHLGRLIAVHGIAAALIFILFPGTLSAQFISQPVNLAYLSQRADVIVQGRVTKVLHESLAGYPNIRTVVVTINVESFLRGTTGKTYTFREIYLGLPKDYGKQSYGVGQRLFLFLPSPSQYGLSSPIGIGQGRFHIGDDSRGSATIANEQDNAGLFRNVEQTVTKAGKRLTTSQRKLAATERGPVALDDFVSLVKGLMTLPRIR
jgi:hypothetical protein